MEFLKNILIFLQYQKDLQKQGIKHRTLSKVITQAIFNYVLQDHMTIPESQVRIKAP